MSLTMKIEIRCTEGEKELFTKAAYLARRSLSSWAREAMIACGRGDLDDLTPRYLPVPGADKILRRKSRKKR